MNPEWHAAGSGTGTVATPNNGDFTNQGYSYAVHYDGSQPGPLNIAIYDPALNQQDNTLRHGRYAGDRPPDRRRAADAGRLLPDRPQRLGALCGGEQPVLLRRHRGDADQHDAGHDHELRRASTRGHPARVGSDQPSGVRDDLLSPWRERHTTWRTRSMNPAAQGIENMPFAAEYHKYVTICSITNPIVGDYIVQVRTNAPNTDMAPVFVANIEPGDPDEHPDRSRSGQPERRRRPRPQPVRHRGVLRRQPDQPGRRVRGGRGQAAHVREPGQHDPGDRRDQVLPGSGQDLVPRFDPAAEPVGHRRRFQRSDRHDHHQPTRGRHGHHTGHMQLVQGQRRRGSAVIFSRDVSQHQRGRWAAR